MSHKMCERCAADFRGEIDKASLNLAVARAGQTPRQPTRQQLAADYANALAIIELLRRQRDANRARIKVLEGSVDYLRYLIDHPVQHDTEPTPEQTAALAYLDGFR